MPGGFGASPALLKGALVVYDTVALGQMPNAIVFQYNPEELSRSLAERPSLKAGDKETPQDAPRVSGPPVESISLKVEIDATDQLESGDPTAIMLGIHPTLAALEMLVMPTLEQLQLQSLQAVGGAASVGATQLPLVLFVWGASRVLPVKVTSLSIRETAFDSRLNPIHAEASLQLQALTYDELTKNSVGYQVYLAMQARREVMAGMKLAGSAARITGFPGL